MDLVKTFADALATRIGDDTGLRVVVGADPGPAAWLLEAWPDRVVPAAGPTSFLAIADGIRLAGMAAVAWLDREIRDLSGSVRGTRRPLLLASERPAHASAAYRAGVTVVQPAFSRDVAPLLAQVLASDDVVAMVLSAQREPNHAWEPPALGEQRVVHRGARGVLLGGGPTAALLAPVARSLAAREVHVTALDAHTLTARSGVDPGLLADHLLAGPTSATRAEALTAIPVADQPVRQVASEVLRILRGG